ncbi:2-dehydro-3-deoxygalactonokinase [Dyadobacter sediminis]|uniref:2-dehydro-3-deoxygalactonokinase n=1 Tax=Dyadobacter sediminis TaxID=1493691 RepID=A0A5R9KFG9_9BACT|nr:2-dehydro-3-deoxygalactonokinase [Dyadobacter sediminis]TLU94855.1 2-dehydro-3-deoxygalactonokinase [Dyadobacter sediminis]GGB87385.1 2-dehydro-3-deoxygalactonokinase [Dyadobacter sediminis]
MEKYLLSCDWGTTSFRLRLVNRTDNSLIGEVISQNGISYTYSSWKALDGIPREIYFRQQLAEQIRILSQKLAMNLDGVTVILSGMASSSIGMQEIPYAQLPFALNGSSILMKHFGEQEGFNNEIMLLSGVSSHHDVMRGEETQLIGVAELTDFPYQENAIFLFPGTHSKHLYVKQGELTQFKTFMTGEVFNLMAGQSILKDSVEVENQVNLSPEMLEPFKAGIEESGVASILNALFTVRTNQLFHLMNKKQNAMFLSGLLIGSELRHLLKETEWKLVLCSGKNLYELYKTAIETLNLPDRTIIVPSEIVDRSATAGQIKVFEHQKLTLNKLNL